MVRHLFSTYWYALLSGAALLIFSGCITADYHGESFPATTSVTELHNDPEVLKNYRIIGRGRASGGFPAVNRSELREKLRELGSEHGADAMLIVGRRIVAQGRIADPAEDNFIRATDDFDQAACETLFNEDISADPGQEGAVYQQIMYAVFLRKK